MCRSIRQTLALQAKLARQMRRDDQARAKVRKARVRSGVKQLIWTEHEPAETPELEARLERILDAEPETLARGSVEAHVQRLGRLLGVSFTVPTRPQPPAGMDPRDKPEGDDQGWGIVTPRRSSA